jgi:hypothetical protein
MLWLIADGRFLIADSRPLAAGATRERREEEIKKAVSERMPWLTAAS